MVSSVPGGQDSGLVDGQRNAGSNAEREAGLTSSVYTVHHATPHLFWTEIDSIFPAFSLKACGISCCNNSKYNIVALEAITCIS